MSRYELGIIGGGSAAFAAATRADDLGVNTALINEGPIGGTCVNVGCIPSKHLLAVGEALYYPEQPTFSSVRRSRVRFDFARAIHEKDEVVEELRKENYREVLETLDGVTFYEGRGRFSSSHTIRTNDHTIEAEKIIIATGSSPNIVPFKGIEDVDFLTNVEALSLPDLPDSLIVIGGRALGLEFAQMYSHLGTRVTVLQRSPRIIPEHEPEISEALRLSLEEEGIEIHTGVQVTRISRNTQGKTVEAAVEGKPVDFEGEHLLIATGRRPNTPGLGLEELGVNLNGDGSIRVNEHMHTSATHVWAAGDVIGKPMLETTAAKEGYVAASNALEATRLTIDYDSVPHAIFTSPQVASVGLTEEELSKRIKACACRTVPMSRVPKARAIKDTRGVIKMVIDTRTAVVAGVHIVSPHAAEIIHEATLAVKHRLTIDDIIGTVHVFPTFSEAIKIAATAFRRDITKMSCCIQ